MKSYHYLFDGSDAQELGNEVTGWRATASGHAIPNCDLREHIESLECWCHPIDMDGVIVHNSADGREFFERGERKPS